MGRVGGGKRMGGQGAYQGEAESRVLGSRAQWDMTGLDHDRDLHQADSHTAFSVFLAKNIPTSLARSLIDGFLDD